MRCIGDGRHKHECGAWRGPTVVAQDPSGVPITSRRETTYVGTQVHTPFELAA